MNVLSMRRRFQRGGDGDAEYRFFFFSRKQLKRNSYFASDLHFVDILRKKCRKVSSYFHNHPTYHIKLWLQPTTTSLIQCSSLFSFCFHMRPTHTHNKYVHSSKFPPICQLWRLARFLQGTRNEFGTCHTGYHDNVCHVRARVQLYAATRTVI